MGTYFKRRLPVVNGMVDGTVISYERDDDRAFYGPIFGNVEIVAGLISMGAANPETEVWARNIVIESLKAKGYPTPSLGMLQIVQAVGRMEGFYGKASNPPEWAGSNNWGAVQQGLAKEGVCPANTFKSKDYDPNKAADYIACFRKYPTPQAGCEDMIRIMMRTDAEKAAVQAADILAVSTAMYDAHYYQSKYKEREKAIAFHSQAIASNVKAIAAALQEPVSTGPSISPVVVTPPGGQGGAPPGPVQAKEPGLDLTPLLFAALPFGFHAAKYLIHMVGDPLLVTPEMTRNKIRDVTANYNRTDDDYAKAVGKKKIALPAYKEWTAQFSKWNKWSNERMGVDGDGISVASATADYEMAKRFDLERFEYAQRLEAAVPNPDRPPEIKPPPIDPGGGVLGGGNPISSLAGTMGTVVAVGGIAWLFMMLRK